MPTRWSCRSSWMCQLLFWRFWQQWAFPRAPETGDQGERLHQRYAQYETADRHTEKDGCNRFASDFDTGYSSLSHLRSVGFDELKIDRSFVSEISTSKRSLAVTHATIQLARTPEMKTVAEGIETEEQARLLTAMGCSFGQGYHFGKPAPMHEWQARQKPNGRFLTRVVPAGNKPTASSMLHASKSNGLMPRMLSSICRVRISGGAARWEQLGRSHRRQLIPIGVGS